MCMNYNSGMKGCWDRGNNPSEWLLLQDLAPQVQGFQPGFEKVAQGGGSAVYFLSGTNKDEWYGHNPDKVIFGRFFCLQIPIRGFMF